MKKQVLAFAFLVFAFAANAADSPKDVQAAISRGDYAGAEVMLREAVSEHPQSAKAHYVLAEVLAHEGNIGDAKAEASKAATLDPATRFTDPAKFQAFQRKLDAALAPPAARQAATTRALGGDAPARVERPQSSGMSPLTVILIVGGVLALIAFLWSRRRRDTQSGFGGPSYSQPPVNPSPYGDSYGPNAGYPPGYPPQAPRGSGVGTAVAAGLGGLAAGALLDEAFRSHNGEGTVREDGGVTGGAAAPTREDPSAQAYDDLRDDPIDMGNNDSGWDDASSGDLGDSDDQW